MKNGYDIIVVGGGGSGLAAAVSAAEHGADVLLLEKQPALGGTTGIAVGSFTASQTRLQKRNGIEDSPESHNEDAGKFPAADIEARNNDELRRYFLSHAADTIHWLMDMGLSFHGPNPEPPNRVPRMHNVVPGAKAYVATLHARLIKLGGTVRVNSCVRRLLQDNDGAVIGVAIKSDDPGRTETEFRAKRGVVLAAGDYANCPATIVRFKGDRYASIEGINPDADGDGHRLAEAVGAKLLNMDVTYGPELRFVPPPGRTFQQLLPTSGLGARIMGQLLPFVPQFVINAMIRRLLVTWQHPENSLFDDGAILVNRNGRRFCDETLWPDREIAVAAQPGKECFILVDRSLATRYSQWPNFISTAPKIAYAYVADYVRLRPDIAIQNASLEAIARQRGIPPTVLRQTVAESNEQRTSNRQSPFDEGQWTLLGPAKAYFTTTEGGAAINKQFQTLDKHGNPIPGLYAVGQTGLGGQILWGHGLHIAWAMTSGRLVGRQLAATDARVV
ncbi:MAG: FAD-dependent oxidoreductase [Planctomycetales bacterium]|jgi:succinate dehydrogenase/fumarate reductase flavoprotein subunit